MVCIWRSLKSPRRLIHPRDLQQIGLHVDDLVVAVPFAREEVLQAVGLEADKAVDEVWQPSRLNILRDNQAWETVA